jgi:hypothetical protein
LTYWGGLSIEDLLALINGWTRATQYRDALGHVFHAEVNLSPDVIVNLAKLGLTASKNTGGRPAHGRMQGTAASSSPPTAPASSASSTTPAGTAKGVTGLLKTLTGTLQGVTGALQGGPGSVNGASGAPSTSNVTNLLNYLLGK